MAMGIDPTELDELIAASGVSGRTADKLRRANQSGASATESGARPGHGAPAPAQLEVDDL